MPPRQDEGEADTHGAGHTRPNNNTVAEPRVSSSRLASCTTCPLSARMMIDQTLTRKVSAAASQPATTAIPHGTNHISTSATIRPIEPTMTARRSAGACQPSHR